MIGLMQHSVYVLMNFHMCFQKDIIPVMLDNLAFYMNALSDQLYILLVQRRFTKTEIGLPAHALRNREQI